ncbi:MAG: BRO family protein, partial [Cyanobacteria bacterium J06649_11]
MNSINIYESNSKLFDKLKKIDDSGTEYWLATELLLAMGYKSWRRIKDTVERAKISAQNSNANVSYHFANVVQTTQIGDSHAFRETLKDYKLSRYACYITAMNGDPRKPEIASAQSYFAAKTREAEITSKNQELLSNLLKKVEQHNSIIQNISEEIRLLKSQVQNLLSTPGDNYSYKKSNYIPPGWDTEVWKQLPPQDKRHFRYLHRRRGFKPNYQTSDSESVETLTKQVKQQQ